jgi:membrane dipeptidase
MSTENDPLIQGNGSDLQRNYAHDDTEHGATQRDSRILRNRVFVWSGLTVLFFVTVIVALVDPAFIRDFGLSGKLPRDPQLVAQRLLSIAPIIVCQPRLNAYHSLTEFTGWTHWYVS